MIRRAILICLVYFCSSCGNLWEGVILSSTKNEITLSPEKEFEIELTLSSRDKIRMDLHEALNETVKLTLMLNLCEKEPFYLGNRRSKTSELRLSNTLTHSLTITGRLYKDAENSLYVIDFFELGKVCFSQSTKTKDIGFTIFPANSSSFFPHDAKGITKFIKFIIKNE